jgi:hypothetical protein
MYTITLLDRFRDDLWRWAVLAILPILELLTFFFFAKLHSMGIFAIFAVEVSRKPLAHVGDGSRGW